MRLLVPNTAVHLSIFALILFAASQLAWSQPVLRHGVSSFADDTVLVRFVPGAAAASVAQAHRDANGYVMRSIEAIGLTVVKVPAGSATQALTRYRMNPNVEFADLNYRRTVFYPMTNEGSEPGLGVTNNFTEQYGLQNTGQSFGATLDPLFGSLVYPSYQATAGADINAPEAWDVTHGDASVAIAVLDSGVACTHLDLGGKCIEEISFVANKSSSQRDELGHGTHVAGIAAAITDNNIGIAGVGWDTSIGALKTCWEDYTYALFGVILGQCDDADVIEAIVHATDSGLYKVISMSFAGAEVSASVETAVNYAWDNGLVLVAAAGNNYSQDMLFPAAFTNVIGVGSTDFHDNLSGFSTFGSWVSVLAPGTTILSTVPGEFCGQSASEASDCYDYKSGTSMAAPHVSGLAALLWAQYPGASNAQIRSLIETEADATGATGQNFLAWSEYGRINMAKSLAGGTGGVDPTSHHVQSITLSAVSAAKGNKRGQAVITVVDNFGNPLGGATVSGTFSGAFSESRIGVTSATGSVTLTTSGTAKGGVSFGFCVNNVAHSETIYDAGASTMTCATY
jgi:thermitase